MQQTQQPFCALIDLKILNERMSEPVERQDVDTRATQDWAGLLTRGQAPLEQHGR